MPLPSPGDRVRVTTKDNAFEGIVLPEMGEFLTIKLANGYNFCIKMETIRELTVLEKVKQTVAPKPQATLQNSKLPTIAILHTGGTIASKVDYVTGAVIARFSPEELIAQFPALAGLANLRSRLIRNMWSDDIRFQHINLLCKEIKSEIEQGCAGVIVTIGTDNLATVAAGIAFALQRISVPVILVGAQRSSDRGSSDAASNLLSAAVLITDQQPFYGVGICMHENASDDSCLLLQATQARKMHTSARAAFKPINHGAYARIDPHARTVTWLRTDVPAKPTEPLLFQPYNEKLHLGMLKAHVHMYASEFRAYDGFDGVVVEGTGLGHLPINEIDEFTTEHTKIVNALKDLIESGTIIVMAPQTIYGQINMDVYAPGRKLQQLGVLGHGTDLPPETAFMKLAWLLSRAKKQDVSRLYATNIVGELGERREPHE